MPSKPDHVDKFLEEIRAELPADLDIEVEGIVDRINGINRRIHKMLDETLEQYDLSSGDWKVLCSLRWQGKPHRRSAGDLARIAELSSGAMTNRLDRLEEAGLVRRRPDPNDRRGVVIEMTEKGRETYERAVGVQAKKEELVTSALRLARDGASRGDLKVANAALKELRYAFQVFSRSCQ